MPAPNVPTTEIQTKLYHATAYLDSPDYAKVKALAVPANRVKRVLAPGDVAKEANIYNWVEFGEPTQASASGPSPLGSFDFSFVTQLADPKHKALTESNPGDAAVVVLETAVGSAITVWYGRGTIASVSVINPGGAPQRCDVSVAFDTAPLKFDAA